LSRLESSTVFVLPWRNPLAVAASLGERDGMLPAFAGLLWLRYVLDAEAASRGKPRFVASYEELMADWRGTLDRSAASLQIEWPQTPAQASADIDEDLPAGLQRHRATDAELENASEVTDWARQICAALPALAENRPEALAVFDRVKAEFDGYAHIFGQASFPEFERRISALVTARDHFTNTTRRLESETRRLAGENEDMQRQLERDSIGLERLEAEIGRLTEARETLVAQSEALDRQLAEMTDRADRQENALNASEAANAGLRSRLGETRGKLAAARARAASLQAELQARFGATSRGLRRPGGLTNRLADAIALVPATVADALARGRLLAGRKVSLVALNDAEGSPQKQGGIAWKFTGNDPQLAIVLPRGLPLPPGHYQFTLSLLPGAINLAAARLYVDEGTGLQESNACNLVFSGTRDGEYMAEFQLKRSALLVRFDPCEKPGRMHLRWTRLRRVPRTEFYCRALMQLARHNLVAPRDLLLVVRQAARTVRHDGLSGLAADVRIARDRLRSGTTTYRDWIETHESEVGNEPEKLRDELGSLPVQPLISILMPVYNTGSRVLTEAIESVLAQTYGNWELCIADDASSSQGTRKVLKRFAASDARIRVVHREKNGHISRATNSALELASGEWTALLDHDDTLAPNALTEVVREINRHPDAQIIYSDEDKIDGRGLRYEPYFKPDYSRELLRSQNYFNHLTVHRTANIRAVGGWRTGFEGSQDYDLNLRIVETVDPASIRHIPKVLYHWRAEEGSTALAGTQKSYAWEAGKRALQEHVARMQLDAVVEPAPDTPYYRVRMQVPDPAPLVSLIIPTCDQLKLLRGCVDSITRLTDYPNYEIIVVDNRSKDRATLAYFEEIAGNGVARVLAYDAPFNFSAINNHAVSRAGGSVVGLINNDIEVISPG
ncbi:MAG: glycosyltransferase, partial [Pseudomonadota bacterium]|nr:glycosyltransferase [Pseudomonadota bacterium]